MWRLRNVAPPFGEERHQDTKTKQSASLLWNLSLRPCSQLSILFNIHCQSLTKALSNFVRGCWTVEPLSGPWIGWNQPVVRDKTSPLQILNIALLSLQACSIFIPNEVFRVTDQWDHFKLLHKTKKCTATSCIMHCCTPYWVCWYDTRRKARRVPPPILQFVIQVSLVHTHTTFTLSILQLRLSTYCRLTVWVIFIPGLPSLHTLHVRQATATCHWSWSGTLPVHGQQYSKSSGRRKGKLLRQRQEEHFGHQW